MTRPSAASIRLLLQDGRSVRLEPGQFIGRSTACALHLAEPGISEAHALVSLRGSALMLLALRGRFMIEGHLQTSAELAEGQTITLAKGVDVYVEHVELPDSVLGIFADGLARQVLPPVASLFAADPTLQKGYVAGHDALIWWDGHRFVIRQRGEADATVSAGDRFELAGRTFHFIPVALSATAMPTTEQLSACDRPLTLRVKYDSVHLEQGKAKVVVSGFPARAISELAAMGVPVEWHVVAKELWPNETNVLSVRQRWDRTLGRLRRQLKDHGLRTDIVRSDRTGNVELVLGPGDQLLNEM